jgi:pilus assembly protein CpaC
MKQGTDLRQRAAGGRARRLSGLLAALATVALVAPGEAARAELPAALTIAAAQGGAERLAPSGAGATVHVPQAARDEDRLRSLQMEMGRSLFLRTDFQVKRVSVGDPDVLDVVVLSPREIQLVPARVGGTNVVLWDQAGTPSAVIDVDVGTSFSHIARQLRAILGTEDVHVESAGEAVVLRGTVSSPLQAERAVAIARAYFPEEPEAKVVNALDVGGNQQVMIEVIIAEMSRTLGRRLAVNWNGVVQSGARTFGFAGLLGGLTELSELVSNTSGEVSVASDITSRVNLAGSFVRTDSVAANVFFEAANEDGLAKILARPTLLARSGQSASFLVGGEVPIPIAQGGAFGSITIQFKEFGVGVQFTPTVLGSDRIHLQVAPEVSEPDFTIGTAVSGFVTPGFVTRRASTTVELGDGQSFAIAGLLRDDVRETIEKYPVLGEVPVLGALFRSARFQRNETELVLVVTPRLVKPLAETPALPTDAFVAPAEWEFYLLGAMEAQRGRIRPDGGSALLGPSGHRIPIAMERRSAR